MNKNIRRTLAAPAGFMLVLGAVALAAPANAATQSPAPTPGQNCWSEIDTGKTLCVPAGQDVAPAVKSTYGITIRYAGTKSTLATESSVTPFVTTVIGILYMDANYGGASWTVTETNTSSGCTGGNVFSFSDLGAQNPTWNNRISSFHSYAGCRTTLYDTINYTGSTYGPATNGATLGVMNDAASSIRWTV